MRSRLTILLLAFAAFWYVGCAPSATPPAKVAEQQTPSAPASDRLAFSISEPVIYRDVHIWPVPWLGLTPLHNRIHDRNRTSSEPLLRVAIRILNLSANRKVDYETWEGGFPVASVHDEYGNLYKRVSFSWDDDVVGHIEQASIRPGAFIDDVLVFEAPLVQAKTLTLELPLSHVGLAERDMLRGITVTIPVSSIAR